MNLTSTDKLTDLFSNEKTPLIYIDNIKGINVFVKCDYLNHSIVQGNKLRKLKYNIDAFYQHTKSLNSSLTPHLITFGGAYSNHISAVSGVGQVLGIKTVGIIRGDELSNVNKWGETLRTANKRGMKLHFASRQSYREKQNSIEIKNILLNYPNYYLIPEGGSNKLAVKGCAEITSECLQQFEVNFANDKLNGIDCIIAACGTAGTLSGIIDGVYLNYLVSNYHLNTKVIGVPVLKGANFLHNDIKLYSKYCSYVNYELKLDYHFAGYGKTNKLLLDFIRGFESKYNIPLDPIYTSKLFYAVFDMIEKSTFKTGQNVVIYHSGGLQGCV